MKRIAIVGGGASGVLVAAHLRRLGAAATVIERTGGQIGRGVAYGTREAGHLLNVPAARMSAFSDAPADFIEWLQRRDPAAGEWTFAPRGVYGEYLASKVGEPVERIPEEALSIDATASGVRIRLASGATLDAERVVLALGNPGPVRAPGLEAAAEALCVSDVWATGACEGLARDAEVVILGTGLTMADVLVSLAARGHQGVVHAVSRHGLLPKEHLPGASGASPLDESAVPGSVAGLLRFVRERAEDGEWRAAVDALRPVTPRIWNALSIRSRRSFLRHLRVYWDVHRHRVAPEVAAIIERRKRDGTLRVHAGRIGRIAREGLRARVDFSERASGALRSLRAARVLNCLGPDHDWTRSTSSLVQGLLRSGIARAHPLGIGIDASPSGALIGRDGDISDRVFTLGPPRIGNLWETTAIPEIRQQARDLARLLCG